MGDEAGSLTVACGGCGRGLDPLRAGRVGVFDERFTYFCGPECRASFVTRGGPPVPEPEAPPSVRRLYVDDEVGPDEDTAPPPSYAARAPKEAGDARPPPASRPLPRRLVRAVGACGALVVALALAGDARPLLFARLALAVVALGLLAARLARPPWDASHPSRVATSAPPALAVLVALVAVVRRDPSGPGAVALAGLVLVSTAFAIAAVERARRATRSARRAWRLALEAPSGRDPSHPRVRVRPGEPVAVAEGATCPVDGVALAGDAEIEPWVGATSARVVREGDCVAAGARVVRGELRVASTYAGHDRAFERLVFVDATRADVVSTTARLGRVVSTGGGIVAAALAAIAVGSSAGFGLPMLVASIAAAAAVSTPAVAALASVHVGRAVLAAQAKGIAYRGADEWEAAADVSTGVFCARGTLLLGEPDLADLEAIGSIDPERVLALVAGAEAVTDHPVASAILRAAAARGIVADAVRSPTLLPGLGVTAVASTGEALVVGSRALMLRERVSVAVAEPTIGEIEGRGRTVLLAALAGKLVGVIGLQDGLRPGARAAVQHLLDAHVEPVLLSGDGRETCEAIARALDIDHVRPEVLPGEKAVEIERLVESGAHVAVIGRPRADAPALRAASVSIALASVGAAPAEWSAALASDDVRHAALAVSLAHLGRHDARVATAIAVTPGAVAALALAFGLAPAALGPVGAIAGTLAALVHARLGASRRAG